jgi:asparagine synthase (glutamine-hydrolysing)
LRTNGFALFRGPGALVRAEGASERVERSGLKVNLDVEEGGAVLAFALDQDRSPPYVHGLAGRGAPATRAAGECSRLSLEGRVLVASRDRVGARPLYVDEGATCIATDHRFYAGAPRLLPSGTSLRTDSLGETRSPLLRGRPKPTLEESAVELAGILGEAVAERVAGRKRVAVSFSGGLDSSLLALLAARDVDVLLCSVYARGSRDQAQAVKAAKALGLEVSTLEMDSAAAAGELRMLDLPFEPASMDKALWCIYSSTARIAAEGGAELILLGQLADELFGGYMKYSRAAREGEGVAAAMMLADVAASADRAFIRDELACSRYLEASFPFADESVASFGIGLPVAYKIAGGERKVVLRRAAELLGLPPELSSAPKKAAQYSSGMARLVG